MPELSETIARHVASMTFEALPAGAVRAARRSLLDSIGVMLAASGLAPEAAPFAALAAESGRGSCRLIGRSERVSATQAAFANGALAHAMDFEDSFDIAPVHPNASMVPAALAWCEEAGGISGSDLLVALAVGCDLVCRLGLALRVDPTQFGWYPPPILGGFGAVAACGRLAGLTPEQLTDAFSLLLCSSTCSAEIKYSPQSHVRSVRDAFPAEAAVRAVQLAARGVRGFDLPFEGKAGLFAMYVRGQYETAPILDGIGVKFYGEDLSFKPWPCCRGTHPFIGSALEIVAEEGIAPDEIERIELTGHPIVRMLDEPQASKRKPVTAIDAKFSLAFTVATALIDQTVTLDSFSPAALGRTDVAELAQRVFVIVDETAPENAIVTGRTELVLRDGRRFAREASQAKGHPSLPLSDTELEAKFRMCAARAATPVRGSAADGLIAAISSLEECPDVGSLLGII